MSLGLAVVGGATGCGGAKAGTVQVTNDTAVTVTVAECPFDQAAGCNAAIGRRQLTRGQTADFAPVRCTGDPCHFASIVVYGYQGATRCAPVPRPDGRHSYLFLVTTLPTTGCAHFDPIAPSKPHDTFP